MTAVVCGVAGQPRSAFAVELSTHATVEDLKNAIKAKKAQALKKIDACDLQLHLARARNKWVTEREAGDVTEITRYPRLEWAMAHLDAAGLSRDQLTSAVTPQHVANGEGAVHILVNMATSLRQENPEPYWVLDAVVEYAAEEHLEEFWIKVQKYGIETSGFYDPRLRWGL